MHISIHLFIVCIFEVIFLKWQQCATFVGNSYQTFGLATVKTYQTELNLTGPNKIMIFYIINAKIHIYKHLTISCFYYIILDFMH